MVLIAGPWVSSAIGNQFNTVAGAIGSGTTGENFYEPEDIPDPENGTAFAIYSEDDHSLMFYKRRGVPKVGEMFNYRHVNAVYTGFEEHVYNIIGTTHSVPNDQKYTAWKTNVPWFDIRDAIRTVKVIDGGITPRSLSFWFYRFSILEDADISNLDARNVSCINQLFLLCRKLSVIKMPGLTSACVRCNDAFAVCGELTSLELPPSDFSNCANFWHMFDLARKLTLDCSDWNVQTDAVHVSFNNNAPGVILPKAWQ